MKTGAVLPSISRKAGGPFESVRRLHQSLARLPDVSVTILSLQDEYTAHDLPAWEPLTVRTFPVIGSKRFGYAPALKHALLELDLEILHSHGLWMYPSVAVSAWQCRNWRPYLLSPHGMLDPWALRLSPWKKRLARWLFEDRHLRRASCLRALTESEAASIRALGLRNPVCVVPNGIDLPTAPPQAPAPWHDLVEPGRKVLLYLGRFHRKKGLVNLLRAWSEAGKPPGRPSATSRSDWVLALAGWDQEGHESELKRLASELRLSDSVFFVGPQFGEMKTACYHDCDAFILPSFSEGLPVVILEAWASGKPVLMTSECNLPQGFAANAATPIQPDVNSIRNGLTDLFSMSPAERTAMGLHGRDLVARRFDWQTIARDICLVYHWLLGGGSKPPSVL